jgi:hypothetical protein
MASASENPFRPSLQEGPSGPASYALIYNPYRVIQHHYEQGTQGLRQDKYHALMERALEIGDDSLSPAVPVQAATPQAAVAATS